MGGGACFDEAAEAGGGEAAVVGAGEEPAAGGEDAEAEGDEIGEVVFEAEEGAVGIAAESGRVEHDAVEGEAFFGEAAEPVEGVAAAEEVGVGVEGVEGEIAAPPVEVGSGEVDAGGVGAEGGGGDAEGAGVGEEVEEAVSGAEALGEGGALGALVEKEALAVAGGEVDFVGEAEFLDGEGAWRGGAGEAEGGLFVLLVEAFPPEGAAEVGGEVAEGGREGEVAGLHDPMAAVGVDFEAGPTVAGAVEEAESGGGSVGWEGEGAAEEGGAEQRGGGHGGRGRGV